MFLYLAGWMDGWMNQIKDLVWDDWMNVKNTINKKNTLKWTQIDYL